MARVIIYSLRRDAECRPRPAAVVRGDDKNVGIIMVLCIRCVRVQIEIPLVGESDVDPTVMGAAAPIHIHGKCHRDMTSRRGRDLIVAMAWSYIASLLRKAVVTEAVVEWVLEEVEVACVNDLIEGDLNAAVQ